MSLQTSPKPRPCKVCRLPFIRSKRMQRVCSVECSFQIPVIAAEKAARKAALADRKQTRAKLDKLRPLSYWQKQAQHAFNAWIRWRDRNEPCISCGRFHDGAHDAGHYLTVGARPELRFDESNCHRQCVPCNQHLHGNLVQYRAGLIARMGLAEVTRLEGPHAPKRYRADDLKAIRDTYRARLKSDSSTA